MNSLESKAIEHLERARAKTLSLPARAEIDRKIAYLKLLQGAKK